MIKETDVQLDVVHAVQEAGGAATKLSNRFLVGVVDLLVKLPDRPAMLVEVKKYGVPARSDTVSLDVTLKQWQFLYDYRRAGMAAGVLAVLIGRKHERYGQVIPVTSGIRPTQSLLPMTTRMSYYALLSDARAGGAKFGPSVVELLRALR